MTLLQDGLIAFLSAVGVTTLVWIVAGAFFRAGRPAVPGLLLYDGENPVCCCTCGPVRLGPSPRQSEGLVIHGEAYRGWGEIISFYTDPACTGRGYGSVLMEEALRRLRADGYLNCYVFVLRENEGARRFYARHGFAWDGTEEHIPFPHDMTCVDLRYTKQL